MNQNANLIQAEEYYQRVLSQNEDDADALHILGVIAHQKGDHAKAEQLISLAIRKATKNSYYFNDLGAVFKASKKFERAISCYERAIQLNPTYHEAYYNLARTFHWLENVEKAQASYRKAIQLNAGYFKAHFNLGILYQEQRLFEKALGAYQKACHINPDVPETYYYIGLAYHESGNLEDAIRYYQKAVDLKPDFFDAYNNMGTAWLSLKKVTQALSCFDKALDLKPDSAAVHVNRGNAFQEQNRYRKALHCYRRALKIWPSNEIACLNMGITLMSLNQPRKSRSCYRRAFQINPRYTKACAYLVNRLVYDCAWSEFENLNGKLDRQTRTALRAKENLAETPFQNISRHADPALNRDVANAWSHRIVKQTDKNGFVLDVKGREDTMIRVGYLSNSFSNHPGAHLISGIFRLHDRSRFEIYSFSYGVNDGSSYRKRIEAESDYFFDISLLSDRAAADLIQHHRIDILIDLRGFTRDSRLSISALRPAPVHVVYLGYPGTTGADFIDYIIADKTVVPEAHVEYFSEKIVFMPHCYQANDNTQKIADRRFNRSDFGIPEDAFAFCSFATHYKIEPVMFDCWTRILNRVPRSVLCLLEGSKTVHKNLRRELVARGIDAKRLIFVKKLPKDEHLARLQLLDLSLDTRIYNGHTTTSDALWAGMPVLTLKGGHFASRVSASILQAIGLPELITDEIGEYEEMAVKIAQSQNMLQVLKKKISENRLKTALFDTPRFTKNLERAYLEMMQIYQAGETPRQIDLKEGIPNYQANV